MSITIRRGYGIVNSIPQSQIGVGGVGPTILTPILGKKIEQVNNILTHILHSYSVISKHAIKY